MQTYRAYLLDKDGHIIAPPEIIACDDDETAIQKAKRLVNGHDVEIWQSSRVVALLRSDDPQ